MNTTKKKKVLAALLVVVITIALFAACGGVKTYKVTFDNNYDGAPENLVVEVKPDTYVDEPDEPQRENWRFDGWFDNQAATVPADFGRVITEDVTFYAGWTQTVFTVTFNPNYSGATATTGTVPKGEKPLQPADPVREGNYLFTGWFTEAACQTGYSFDNSVTVDITLYAGWEAYDGNSVLDIVFANNYDGGGDYYTTQVLSGRRVTKPGNPVREGYAFLGWYTDADTTDNNIYDFDSTITANLTLYAKWRLVWTFEAEYTDLSEVDGHGYSGEMSGTEIIDPDNGLRNASNGHYVTYLYSPGIEISFEVYATEAVSDATLVLRLAIEQKLYPITSDMFTVEVVGQDPFQYNNIEFKSITAPFENYIITSALNLAQGKNTIKLTVNNSTPVVGTMYASAPMLDCMYIYTDTEIRWADGYPLLDNMDFI